LDQNQCRVYEHRPKACRSYPHLHKKDFVSRLVGVLWNYSICPMVFNVFERLKDELRHKSGDAWNSELYWDNFTGEEYKRE
jgi:Fe-S-cluster containining protein